MDSINENDKDIFIIKYKKESEYTTIFNHCINDENLSADSVAILVYVMSKPDDWKINIKNISNRYNIGRDKVRNSINNLRESGYVKRVRQRKKDGSLSNILIYASDSPVFLSRTEPVLPEGPVENHNEKHIDSRDPDSINETNKQPAPEIQAVVTVEKTDKQPRPENPAPVNQALVPYIQKKDSYKENNNNLNTAYASAPALPNESDPVVVFLLDKIRNLPNFDISEQQMDEWVIRYGKNFVGEKIELMKSKSKILSQGGYLRSALAYDWKAGLPVTERNAPVKPEAAPVEIDDAKNWFKYLKSEEKLAHYQKAISIWPALEWNFKSAKAEVSVLDENFVDGPWFKPMMHSIGLRL